MPQYHRTECAHLSDSAGYPLEFERWSGDEPGEGSLLERRVYQYDASGNLVNVEVLGENSEGDLYVQSETTLAYQPVQDADVMNLVLWQVLFDPFKFL